MLAVAATAKQFGVRPSALMVIRDEVLALSFDLAAAVKLHRAIEEDGGGAEIKRVYL